MDELAACVRRLGACPSLVLGDFNALSTAWGSRRSNGRGRDVQDWAAALDLRLMNRGSTGTCVAWRGKSIVDPTWASAAASHRVSGWGVSPEETLSPSASGPTGPPGRRRRLPRRGLHGSGRYSCRLVGRISDRRGRGGGSDPAETRLPCDLRFMYAVVRSHAPCRRGVLVVRRDR